MPRKKFAKLEEEEFQVEVLLAARVAEGSDAEKPTKKRKRKGDQGKPTDGLWEYLVKWHNYDDDSNTWEPEANLLGECSKLLDAFWNEGIGMDNEDYPPGIVLKAKPKWIANEKKRFAAELALAEEKAKKKAKEKEEKRKQKREKEKAAATKVKVKQREVKKERRSPFKSDIGKRRPVVTSDRESSLSPLTDSDVPLVVSAKRRRIDDAPAVASSSKLPEVRPVDHDTASNLKRKRSAETENSGDSRSKHAHTKISPSSLFSEDEGQAHDAPPATVAPPPLPRKSNASSIPPRPANIPPPLPTRPPVPARSKSGTQSQAGPGLAQGGSSTKPNGSVGSVLSTKQRLAQGALDPTVPKMLSAPGPKPAPRVNLVKASSKKAIPTGFRATSGIAPASHGPTPASSSAAPHASTPPASHGPTLASLNTAPAAPTAPTAHGPTLASLNAGPDSPTAPAIDLPSVASPAPLAASTHADDLWPSYDHEAEVNNFLSSIMPPELAGPLEPAPEIPAGPRPPAPLIPKVSRIAQTDARPVVKSFQWLGAMIVASFTNSIGAEDKVTRDTSFDVLLNDVTNAPPPALRFSLLLKSASEIRTQKLYRLHDLHAILSACKTPVSYGTLTLQVAKSDEAKKQWILFVRYLQKSEQVLLVPLHLDGNVVAHLMVSTLKNTRNVISSIPGQVINSITTPKETLIACLLPWALAQMQIESECRGPVVGARTAPGNPFNLINPHKVLKQRPRFEEATRSLGLTAKMWDSLYNSPRLYTICFSPRSASPASLYEVQLLRTIIEEVNEERAINNTTGFFEATSPESATMILIHVGTLPHLDEFPYLEQWSTNKTCSRFFTFGTHPLVDKARWGFNEIFPCGGVVTFVPSVFLRCPYEVRTAIRKVKEHPFWITYILPSVLGMIANLGGIEADTIDQSPYAFLFKAIENGDIALIEAPPDNGLSHGQSPPDRRHRWFENYASPLQPTAAEALSIAKSAFASMVANRDPRTHQSVIEREVATDLMRMRTQPAIMTNYRRFIVLGGVPGENRRDSLEWITPDSLVFGDEPIT